MAMVATTERRCFDRMKLIYNEKLNEIYNEKLNEMWRKIPLGFKFLL